MGKKKYAGDLKQVVEEMERCIKKLGAPSAVKQKDEFLEYQHRQLDGLVELELEFRDLLVSKPELAQTVYEAFALHVEEKLPSILSARSYFRERQTRFVDTLARWLTEPNWRGLATYRINYRFVHWALTTGKLGAVFRRLAKKIERLRHEMVLLLMPLAISRTRMFWGVTPESHQELRDLAQTSFEGLLTAVDKFCPPFSRVYRAVAIGRSTGALIESYTETLLHFYPNDRKILYRAHKLAHRMDGGAGVDFERMASRLNSDEQARAKEESKKQNKTVQPAFKATAEHVSELMSAASHISADALVGTRRAVGRMVAPADQAPDVQAEQREVRGQLLEAVKQLPLEYRKLLCLKGMIEVEEV